MTITRIRRTLLLCVLSMVLSFSAGCMSLSERTSPSLFSAGSTYYVGMQADYLFLAGRETNAGSIVFGLLDLPFSLVLDTILLPVDFIGHERNHPDCLAIDGLNYETFRTIFAPTRFRRNCYHYYHGDRDGIAYVSFMEFTGQTTFWNHSGRVWHRWRIPLKDLELPRSFPFSDWDHREHFDIFGDLAYLEAARSRLQVSAPPSMVKGVTKFQYQPVSVPDAPTGTWAFVETTLEGKNLRRGYLYAPGWEQCRDMIDKYGVHFSGYPYRFGGLAGVQVGCNYNPQNHTAAWLKDWYYFTENPP